METFQLKNFDFNKIKLSTPQAIQGGGAYFTNLTFDDNPIYLQFPKCKSKSGIISTKKTKYIDLMYKNEETSLIHEWLENLENKCKNLLDDKKNIWFTNELTKDDLDSMLTPCSRIYKNGKFILLRMIINNSKKNIKIESCEKKPIGCGIMFRTQQLLNLGLYNESFKYAEEEALRKIFLKKHSITRIPLNLYRYRQHKNNRSKNFKLVKLYSSKIK